MPKGGARKRAAAVAEPVLPERIFAQVSPRSVGGVSLFEALGAVDATTVASFQSERSVVDQAANRLLEAGFEVLQVTRLTINIAGPREAYEKAFSTTLEAQDRPVIKSLGKKDTATFVEAPETPLRGLISTAGTRFYDFVEGVALEEPRYLMAPSAFPPLKAYWHLDVPAGVSLAANADRAHRGATTGLGVKVAMVDTGHFRHPYFVGRGYRVAPVVLGPGTAHPQQDDNGHGTGESANIFAVAPDAELLPVKMSFVNTIAAFNTAVALRPDVITCSWGSSKQTGPLSAADQALAAAIAAAWAAGIVVVFSAGNGHWGFPGQHPDVISAGGVFMAADETLRASDYASGFMSQIYSGRRTPDLCGLVGMQPRAQYIMLPIQPGCDIDLQLAGGTHPNGDETKRDDGWAAFSGTSAAAPQLAGAAALVKQACSRLSPAEVRDVLMKSARDVTQGTCHPNTGANPATPGPDLATGYGLVDAHKAVLLAKVRCLGPRVGPRPGPIPRPEPAPEPGPVRQPQPGPEPGPRAPHPQPPGPPPVEPRPAAGIAEATPAQPQLTAEDIASLEEMVIQSQLEPGDLG